MAVIPIRPAGWCDHRGELVGQFPVRDGSGRLTMQCALCDATLIWDGAAWVALEVASQGAVRASARR